MTDAIERSLTETLNGLPRDEPFQLPGADDFLEGDFLESDELSELATAIIGHYDRFSWGRPTSLLGIRIRYLWQRKGGKKSGATTLGWCAKSNGITHYMTGVDYIIAVVWDAAVMNRLSCWQIEALLFHELCHVELALTKEGKLRPKLRNHDIEMFNDEVRYYGLWEPSLEATADAFEQRPLLANAVLTDGPPVTTEAPVSSPALIIDDREMAGPDPASDQAPKHGMRLGGSALGEELIWNEEAGCFYGAQTGERVDGTVADIIRGSIGRMLDEQR